MRIYMSRVVMVSVVALVLAGSACLFSPEGGGESGVTDYFSPVDTPEKLLANFQLAYQTKNLDAYMDCLHEEFEFILLEVDWDDYTGNGEIDQSWGRDIEEQMTSNMFSSDQAEVIELTLDGNTETVWWGDPSGETLQLIRNFDLKVYFYQPDGTVSGFHALGIAKFLCKPNAEGDYQIWRWEDQSET
ncbi:MAG: hypothetical protein J7K88_02315 [Candidatus Fermentibacteraceae bacterium]|nr:hypothetical protein [Candidatus Fermentibacteraceae bacterium]